MTAERPEATPDADEDGTDSRLLWLLRKAGDEWGPLGVLRTAQRLWPDAAAHTPPASEGQLTEAEWEAEADFTPLTMQQVEAMVEEVIEANTVWLDPLPSQVRAVMDIVRKVVDQERILATRRAPEGEATAEQVREAARGAIAAEARAVTELESECDALREQIAAVETVLAEWMHDFCDAADQHAVARGIAQEVRGALADPGRALAEHDARVLDDAADDVLRGSPVGIETYYASQVAGYLRARATRLRGES